MSSNGLTDKQVGDIREAIHGDRDKPVHLTTSPETQEIENASVPEMDNIKSPPRVHNDNTEEIEVTSNEVITLFQSLYPTQFNHVVAECKANALERKYQEALEVIAQLLEKEDS